MFFLLMPHFLSNNTAIFVGQIYERGGGYNDPRKRMMFFVKSKHGTTQSCSPVSKVILRDNIPLSIYSPYLYYVSKSSYPINIVTYYIKGVTTSSTNSTVKLLLLQYKGNSPIRLGINMNASTNVCLQVL